MEDTLRDLRLRTGKTAAEVAAQLKIARSTYSNYEQGTRTIDIHYIIPLAELLECTEREVIAAQIKSQNAR